MTAGVDTKANPFLVLHKQIISFFNVCQGQNETEDEYLVHLNSTKRSLEIMGGEQIFVSTLIVGSDIGLETVKNKTK